MASPLQRRPRRRRGGPRHALVRGAAIGSLVAAFAVPLVRRRLGVHPAVTTASVAAAPLALAVAKPRTKGRDAAIFALQMWAFIVVHELPLDDEKAARRRLRVRYPIRLDTAIGGGELPTLRLQRGLLPDGVGGRDTVLTWVHWLWFLVPHTALAWILFRHNERFPDAAARMGAVFDLGLVAYAAVPTAPPWWASEHGYTQGRVRRVMVEVGERFWGRLWPSMYDFLGGNPWAAMPSLHFATSVMAAIVLAEAGPVEGAAGWSYALTLGFALVYLGEHYLCDLIAGAALVTLVQRGAPHAEPAVGRLSRGLQALERLANP